MAKGKQKGRKAPPKEKKIEQSLKERIDHIESLLGMSEERATRNVHMLLDTITVQGEQMGKLQQQMQLMGNMLTMRDQYLNDKKLMDDFNVFVQETAKKQAETEKAKKEKEHNGGRIEHADSKKGPTTKPPKSFKKLGDEKMDKKQKNEKDNKDKKVVNKDQMTDAEKVHNDSDKNIVNDQ